MGVRNASSGNNTIVTPSIANGVEGIAALTGTIGLVQDNAQVLIFWFVSCSVGASAAQVIVKLRRGGTLTGTQLNVNNLFAVVANTNNSFSGVYPDTPGVSAGSPYALTVQVSGGAAALTVNDVCLVAMVL